MGKASRFIKSLLGFKTTNNPPPSPSEPDNKKLKKRRWSLGTSSRANPSLGNRRNASKSIDGSSVYHHQRSLHDNEDSNNHAIALAAATAAAVEAAIVAAHAAAEVVRMTGRSGGYGIRDELAAIKIQSYFRAYLARRALRALKALVKLQAVVRGHILRKHTADMMKRLQALIRAQTRACAARSQITNSTTKPSSYLHHHRNDSDSYVQGITDQERTFLYGIADHEGDKIVEVDSVESRVMTKGRRLFQPDQISFGHSHSLRASRRSTLQPINSSPCTSYEVDSFHDSVTDGVCTPGKSDGSRSCISSYSDHPNYMANTKSSLAKVRSISAPRLRPQLEVSNTTKRDSGYKYVSGMQQVPSTYDSFAKKTYSRSGRHDQHRLPAYDIEESDFCVDYWS